MAVLEDITPFLKKKKKNLQTKFYELLYIYQ
jgi:hypothetical protein